MEKKEYFDWVLLGIRLIVGATFVIHGAQGIIGATGVLPTQEIFSLMCGYHNSFLFICLAPVLEIIGGGLILSGMIIELGTLLVVPAIIIVFFIANIQTQSLMQETNIKFVFNLVALAITIGFCGPGKWALWDPRKTVREKIF